MRQVTRQLRDARLAQDEREREGGAALDGARRELASLGQALEERTAAAARLEGDARTALERWEGAERESARLRERICEVELGAGEWCASVGERLAGMEGWCGEMERAMGEAWGECAQVREAELVFVLHVFRPHGLDVRVMCILCSWRGGWEKRRGSGDDWRKSEVMGCGPDRLVCWWSCIEVGALCRAAGDGEGVCGCAACGGGGGA